MNVVEGFSEFSWRLSELYFRHLFGGHLKEIASANRNMESETRTWLSRVTIAIVFTDCRDTCQN